MGIPTVKLVADVTPEVKEKLRRIAQKRGISIKDLIIQLVDDLPEEAQAESLLQKDEDIVSLKSRERRDPKQLKRPPI